MLLESVIVLSAFSLGAPYAKQLAKAERVSNLGRFLETYLGDCMSSDPEFDRKGCLKTARSNQKSVNGKLHVLEVDNVAEIFHLQGWDKKRKAFRVGLTPFFSDRGLAMSAGRPKKWTRDGLPVMRNVPLFVKLPDGETEFSFRRRLERGMVRVEVIFKPKKEWAAKAGGEIMRGLAMKLVGIRMYSTRNGNILAEQSY